MLCSWCNKKHKPYSDEKQTLRGPPEVILKATHCARNTIPGFKEFSFTSHLPNDWHITATVKEKVYVVGGICRSQDSDTIIAQILRALYASMDVSL